MTNPNAGPWAPPGQPEAPGFVRKQHEAETEAFLEYYFRDQVRQELERSGVVDEFIRSKVDERVKELRNAS